MTHQIARYILEHFVCGHKYAGGSMRVVTSHANHVFTVICSKKHHA
jgi:hypothetical protein